MRQVLGSLALRILEGALTIVAWELSGEYPEGCIFEQLWAAPRQSGQSGGDAA